MKYRHDKPSTTASRCGSIPQTKRFNCSARNCYIIHFNRVCVDAVHLFISFISHSSTQATVIGIWMMPQWFADACAGISPINFVRACAQFMHITIPVIHRLLLCAWMCMCLHMCLSTFVCVGVSMCDPLHMWCNRCDPLANLIRM